MLNVDSLLAIAEISVLEMGLDLIVQYIAGILVSTFGADRSNNHHLFIPALEIGHVLAAGEIIIIVSCIATESEIADAP